MQQKEKTPEKTNSSRQRIRIIAAAVVIVALASLLSTVLFKQERSITAYCNVYSEEKARLAKLPGNTYPSGVFNDELSDASEFAKAFEKLESVAPDEIRPDVKNLQGIYKKMADDPSQAITASLSGMGAESSVKKWTIEHCAN